MGSWKYLAKVNRYWCRIVQREGWSKIALSYKLGYKPSCSNLFGSSCRRKGFIWFRINAIDTPSHISTRDVEYTYAIAVTWVKRKAFSFYIIQEVILRDTEMLCMLSMEGY